MRWSTLSLFLVALTGCGPLNPLFAGGPYKGKVIDDETKEPLVEAVVLAVWYRSGPTLVGTPKDFLDAEEVLTDNRGEFVVGKNPPASLIPGTWVTDPDIIIFKPGHGFFPRYHTNPPWPPTRRWKDFLQMMEEGVTIELPKLKTKEERLKVIGGIPPTTVPKEKMPNFIRLLNSERKQLNLQPEFTK